jgi:hypothetical protein
MEQQPGKVILRYFPSYQFYSKHAQKWRVVRNINGKHKVIARRDSKEECEKLIRLLPQTPADE